MGKAKNTCLILLLILLTTNAFSQGTTIDNAIKISNNKLSIYENPDKAIKIGDSIYNHQNSNIQDKVSALLLISDGYSSKRDYQSALLYFTKAMELSKEINNKEMEILLYNRAGVKYQQLRLYDKALENLDISLNLMKKHSHPDSIRTELAMNHIVKGFIYKDQLNCNIAIDYFDKGLEELEKVKLSLAASHISIATYNKGNCYISLKKYDEAKNNFNRSIDIAKKVNANSLVAFSQKGLAEVATLEGRYNDAIEILNEALHNSNKVGDRILNRTIYKGLSINFLALNNFSQFDIYNKKFLDSQLEIKISERNSISTSMEDIVNSQGIQKDNIQKKFKINIIILLIISLILISGLILIIVSTHKNIQENKTKIDLLRSQKK